MSFDVIIGLLMLWIAFQIFRAILKSFTARKEPAAAQTPKPASMPKSPWQNAPKANPAPVYRGPRDTTARTGQSAMPRVAGRLNAAMNQSPARAEKPRQNSAPFIMERPRRFPLLGLLALAMFIVVILAAYRLATEPERKPLMRSADAVAASPSASRVLESMQTR